MRGNIISEHWNYVSSTFLSGRLFFPRIFILFKIPVIMFFYQAYLETPAGPNLRKLVFELKALTNIIEIYEPGVSALEVADTQLVNSTQNNPQQNPAGDFRHYLIDP